VPAALAQLGTLTPGGAREREVVTARQMRLLPPLLLSVALALFTYAMPDRPRVEMYLELGIAFATLPIAYLLALRLTGAATPRVDRAATLRWAALFPSFLLATAAFAALVVPTVHFGVSLAVRLLFASILFLVAAKLWFLPLRPIYGLESALADPARADQAAKELVQAFERGPHPKSGILLRQKAQRALAAVTVLSETRRFEDAKRVLDSVHAPGLDPLRRTVLEASRAMVLLYYGDRNGAWSALKEASSANTSPKLARILTMSDALLSALDRHGEEALTRLAEIPEPAEVHYRRAWLLAKSHALAATGDEPAARAALIELKELSPDGLERALLLDGPASKLAKELSEAPTA
jgi:hypothetical protein